MTLAHAHLARRRLTLPFLQLLFRVWPICLNDLIRTYLMSSPCLMMPEVPNCAVIYSGRIIPRLLSAFPNGGGAVFLLQRQKWQNIMSYYQQYCIMVSSLMKYYWCTIFGYSDVMILKPTLNIVVSNTCDVHEKNHNALCLLNN